MIDMFSYKLGRKRGGGSAELAEIKAKGGVGYDTRETVELVPKASYDFEWGAMNYPISELYDEGSEVITTIDGVTYRSVLQATAEVGYPAVFAGNGITLGLPDTGEPYLAVIGEIDGTPYVMLDFLPEIESQEPTQHTVSVVVNAVTVHPINEKYLPEALQFGEDKAFEPIVWDGSTDGLETMHFEAEGTALDIYKVYDKFVPLDSVEKFSVELGGEVQDLPKEWVESSDNGWMTSRILASNGQFDIGMGVIPEGIWMFYGFGVPEEVVVTILPATTVKPLDEKYMPTLTSPSGKKYKLTVDDSGTLSAVEVTE